MWVGVIVIVIVVNSSGSSSGGNGLRPGSTTGICICIYTFLLGARCLVVTAYIQ